MKTIIVWVLIIYMSGDRQGGPAVIDNIASQKQCQQVAAVIRNDFNLSARTKCIAMRKVVP